MKRYIKWLLSIWVLCFIIILIKNEYSYKLLENANYGMPALIEKGKVKNLYIGSSMFRQGIDIMTLEENGEDNYVLAYNGNLWITSWIMSLITEKCLSALRDR